MSGISGSRRLERRKNFRDYDDAEGYVKRLDDVMQWSWDWSNDLEDGFYHLSQQAAFAKVYDDSATDYRDIISRSWDSFTEMAAWPDVATLQATDTLYIGNLDWPDEAAFEIETPSTPAVYGGDALTWEYYNGTAWAALTLDYDETDTTAFDGKRSFQGGGEIRFDKPAAMASLAVDGRTAEWIRVRPTTVANVTTVPIFEYADCDEFVSSASYDDDGVTRSEETLDGNVTSALVAGVGEFECTITSSVGRVVQRVFRFYEPEGAVQADY